MFDPAGATRRAAVAKGLTVYFERLLAAHARATASAKAVDDRTVSVGEKAVRLRLAGAALVGAVRPALAHLPTLQAGQGEFEIFAWDEAESGVRLPPPPWPEPSAYDVQRVLPAGGEGFRIPGGDDGVSFAMMNVETRQAVWWTKDARALPTHHCAAPFMLIFQWWVGLTGLRLLHAGCVGTEAGAVLLVGKGGSGKSTTSLLCALAGMDYLSDDYCLVQAGANPEAFCLYNSGKLHRDHLKRFPELAARAVDPGPDIYQKPVIFMEDAFPGRVKASHSLRAVLAPQVTGGSQTRAVAIGSAEALRSLAPSTLLQMPHTDAGALADMGRLVKALPCYRLELGTDFTGVAPAVRTLIESLS